MLFNDERKKYDRMPISAWHAVFGDPEEAVPWVTRKQGCDLERVYQLHTHDEVEVHQIRRGHVYAEVRGETLTLEPGDILIINPWEPHQGFVSTDEVTEYIHTAFLSSYFAGSCGAAGDVFRQLQAGEVCFANRLAAEHLAAAGIGAALDRIHAEYRAAASGALPETAADCRLTSSVSALMALLLEAVPLAEADEVHVRNIRFAHAMQTYVEHNYEHMLTTGQVAAEMGYNVSYFCTMFKQNFGMSFKQYLNSYRMAQAKFWYNDLPLAEIAEKLGFSDYNYFARVCRQQTGMTPSEYFGVK